MSALPKLAGFAAALGVLFGVGALAGALFEPDAPRAEEPMTEMTEMTDPVRGLAVAENGLRLQIDTPEPRAGTVRFRILDEAGEAVRHFDVEHTKRMHVIVVRRDLTGFQHLHPTQAADGSWSAPLAHTEPGSYRLFADFSRGGEATTLAGDLRVDGPADLKPLAEPASIATAAGGYEVELDAQDVRAGREADLRFTITRDGRPVRTEPYLGAGGHLVALREGDLAYLHVHPTDGVGFEATFPTEGRYRLFLQFQHEGRVRTAAFTLEIGR